MKLLDAYKLFHRGAITLARMEHHGIRVDTAYLDRAIAGVDRQVKKLQQRMRDSDVWQTWRKRYGDRANLGSRVQLGVVLYGLFKVPCPATTTTGRPSTDESVLEQIDLPFVRWFL